jgi:Zn-finger nucleic acid-binding protein
MKCPRCSEELAQERVLDIPIQRCPKCRGILLERGQAEAIDELDLGPSIEGGAEMDPASRPDNDAHCHACDEVMIPLVGAGDIEFDWCASCERIFFDKGELSAFDATPESS